MTKSSRFRALMLASTAAMMFFSVGARPMRAQETAPVNGPGTDRGGVRGGDGQTVQAVVKLNGAPVAGVTVTFKATKSVTATTDANGVASLFLVKGKYTVTASNGSGSGKKMITVVKSTDTMITEVPLTPKAP